MITLLFGLFSFDNVKVSADKGDSFLRYNLSHPMHESIGTSKDFICNAYYDNVIKQINKIAIAATVASFDSKNSSRDSHALEVLEAIKYPKVSFVSTSIKDNGKGIPQEILPRVSENGFSFEKPHGSGLGLYHAQKVINSFGGRLQITSEINLGTEVQIKLPLSQPPTWFLPFVELNHFEQVVVIDDDDSIHKIWSSRIKIPLKHFYDFKEAQKWTLTNRSAIDKSLFFVDYEIQSQTMTGLDFILENNLLKNAYLITGRYSEKEIIKKCLENKIKLIPKKLAGIIPLHSNEF
jgi:hypothetical protein